ncbi:MAG TPA: hypothetical protein VI997_01740 [Candidatus Thermoplasmatota archaeon]|nr:hypothetical protein [Candidatus Thermoplasmatota archaeon]
MRRAGLLLAILLVATIVPTPSARADAATLTILDERERPRVDFHRPEKLTFQVAITTTAPRALDHKIYLYRGTDTSGSNVAILDDGATTNTATGVPATFRYTWDQYIGGVWLGTGLYVAQYRLPGGSTVTARFNLEYAPDHDVTAIGFVEPMLSQTGTALAWVHGCARNIGVRPAMSVNITVESRSQTPATWFPQLTTEVVYEGTNTCPFAPATGTYFRIPFTPIATPGGAALREVAVHANANGAEWEPNFDNNVKTRAATWLL